jgi:NhaA family Na+:H+ antiporter
LGKMRYMSVARERPPAERIVRPFQDFTDKQSSGGIVLIAATVIALLWANSPWAESYAALWHTKLTVGVGDLSLSKDLTHWVNDGLMAVFFLVVGLEIKREILVGELSSVRNAALPVAAALGGAVVPALIYLAINAGTEGSAVLVIALFYTSEISWGALGVGVLFLAALIVANLLGVDRTLVYAVLGMGLWLCFLLSGVHATIAGVLLALTVPAVSFMDPGAFLDRSRYVLARFEKAGEKGENVLANDERQAALHALNHAAHKLEPPLQELEHALNPWVVFAIMPIFALANAGVSFGGAVVETLTSPIALGIVAGLIIGKQLGITLFAWLAVRSGVAELPEGISWRHVYGAGWLAGIGFTMSLFITDLAFSEDSLVEDAKVSILGASLIAGVVGWMILRGASRPR